MEQWYTLYTKPNAEHLVAATLAQRHVVTYLPELEKIGQRRKYKSAPFFPCYLFAHVDLVQVNLSTLQWTPGLRYVVAVDGRPIPIPDPMIDFIRRKLAQLEIFGIWPVCSFNPGDPVRITDGPFKDMVAIFEGPDRAAHRVRVLLNILGQLSRTQVDFAHLEKAPGGIPPPLPKPPRRTRGRGRRIKAHHPVA
jgi:transcription elongation factor/antiterminator RfaH